MRIQRVVTTLAVLLSCVVALETHAAEIPWSPERLTWEVFSGSPAQQTDLHVAEIFTRYSFGYEMEIQETEAGRYRATITSYHVDLVVITENSWVLPGHDTADVLRHEQCHFDLYEVYRRKMELALRQPLSATASSQALVKERLNQAFRAILDPLLEAAYEIQELFDEETSGHNHDDEEALARWEAQVIQWLRAPYLAP